MPLTFRIKKYHTYRKLGGYSPGSGNIVNSERLVIHAKYTQSRPIANIGVRFGGIPSAAAALEQEPINIRDYTLPLMWELFSKLRNCYAKIAFRRGR